MMMIAVIVVALVSRICTRVSNTMVSGTNGTAHKQTHTHIMVDYYYHVIRRYVIMYSMLHKHTHKHKFSISLLSLLTIPPTVTRFE